MIPEAAVRPLTEAELDRLEALLDAPPLGDTAMRTDALHGFLTAVASAPVTIPVEVWLAEALGDATAAADSAHAEVRALLQRLYAEVALLLVEGHGVDPLLYPLDADAEESDADEALDYATWCEGYIVGMELADPRWSEYVDGDELALRLTPFFALALEGAAHEEDAPEEDAHGPLDELSAEELAALVQASRERLPEAVQDVYDYLAEHRPKAEPMRREAPKVGRNEACPCGSGRKFKRCCGAGAGE
jgi:uncharacterized protein